MSAYLLAIEAARAELELAASRFRAARNREIFADGCGGLAERLRAAAADLESDHDLGFGRFMRYVGLLKEAAERLESAK